jgi:hypothetical protein
MMERHVDPSTTLVHEDDPTLRWLRDEFPDWEIGVARTTSEDGLARPLWTASRDGHHPQAALSAAKLHSRLADYLDRETRRLAARN